MTKHKWANEIIAWAMDTSCIEFRQRAGLEWKTAQVPSWELDFEYRIKPQPKEKKSLYAYTDCGSVRVVINHSIAQGHWTYLGRIEVQND